MSIESFGTERDDIQGNRFQKLKMKTGEEYRIGIIYFDDDIPKRASEADVIITGESTNSYFGKRWT